MWICIFPFADPMTVSSSSHGLSYFIWPRCARYTIVIIWSGHILNSTPKCVDPDLVSKMSVVTCCYSSASGNKLKQEIWTGCARLSECPSPKALQISNKWFHELKKLAGSPGLDMGSDDRDMRMQMSESHQPSNKTKLQRTLRYTGRWQAKRWGSANCAKTPGLLVSKLHLSPNTPHSLAKPC